MHFPKACLFDLDGVLLDTEHLHSEAWFRTTAKFGTRLSKQQLLLLKGRRRLACVKQIIKWTKYSVKVEDFLKLHQPISRKLMANIKPVLGAEDLINWCFENKVPMALVTSSSSTSVEFKTGTNFWLKLIKTRVHGDDPSLKKGKPSPDPFLLAAKKLGVDPKDCWAIEDSDSGISSALSAGCQVWILNNDQFNVDNNSRHNSFHIKQLSQFLENLKEIRLNRNQ